MLSFRESRTPEARCPGRPLVGNWVNKGSPGAARVRTYQAFEPSSICDNERYKSTKVAPPALPPQAQRRLQVFGLYLEGESPDR